MSCVQSALTVLVPANRIEVVEGNRVRCKQSDLLGVTNPLPERLATSFGNCNSFCKVKELPGAVMFVQRPRPSDPVETPSTFLYVLLGK